MACARRSGGAWVIRRVGVTFIGSIGMGLGLLLPDQRVVFGTMTTPELLELADLAELVGGFDGLLVGDRPFLSHEEHA